MRRVKEMGWKAAKLWWRLDTIGCIVLLVVIGGILVSYAGFPREIEETCEAAVITESGEVLSCQVRVQGSVTHYPMRKDRDAVDSLSVWVEDRLVVEFEHGGQGTIFSSSYRYAGILDREREILLAELDVQTLFPELEKMQCVISIPATDRNVMNELLEKMEPPDSHKSAFAWVMEDV